MRELQAGPLSFLLDERDVRRVRWGEVELLRRLGVAVRDETWRTVPACSGEAEVLRDDADGLAIRVAARHAGEALDVRWEGRIDAGADGSLRYAITWRAEHDAVYNRIGLVALLPPRTVCGTLCATRGPDGEQRVTLPEDIAPQPYEGGRFHAMRPPFSSFSAALADGELTLAFTGDLFEIEDQRNWADDSFKIYGTPLALVLPQQARAGKPVEQAVGLSFTPSAASRSEVSRARARARTAAAAVRIGAPTGARVPAVGLALPDGAGPPAPAALDELRRIAPGHLRHDAHPARPGWEVRLRDAAAVCAQIGCPLELAVHARDPRDVAAVIGAAGDVPVARALIFGTSRDTTSPECCTPAALATAARGLVGPDVPVAGGTDLTYAELNRWRPATSHLDAVSFAVSPQAHEQDDLTVVENVHGMAATVASARRAFPSQPIVVGRAVLREGEADERLATPFGAAWALAATIALIGAGAASVTAFATHGDSGVLTVDGRPLPPAGALAALSGVRGARILGLHDVPAPVTALAAETRDGRTLLLANPGDSEVLVSLAGLRPIAVAPRSWRLAAGDELSA